MSGHFMGTTFMMGGLAVLLALLMLPARKHPGVLTVLAGGIVICLFFALMGFTYWLASA
jgi:hypothetical protein